MLFIFTMGLHLSRVLSSAIYSVAATIFFRRSFRREHLHSVGKTLFAGYVTSINWLFGVPLFLLLLTDRCYRNFIRTCTLGTFCSFFVALLDITQLVPEYQIRTTITVTLIASAIQFIRIQSIKHKLRGVRAKLGPIFVLYGFRTASLVSKTNREISYLIYASAIISLSAGIFARPDNNVVLSLFVGETSMYSRKTCHRLLMIVSFTWYPFGVMWFHGIL